VEIIRSYTEGAYRARPELAQSTIKLFGLATPAHAKHAMDNRQEATDSMLVGTCLHALVLENRMVYAVEPQADGRTKEGKAVKAAFAAENGDKIILSAKDAAKVEGMASGIRRNRGAMLLLDACADRELSLFWDGYKARVDGACPLGILDLKTTHSASPAEFERSILNFGYHIQGVHYLEGAAACGICSDDFFIVAVESAAPFECAVYKIDHDSLSIGRTELHRLRKIAKRCIESGEYPGYSHKPEPIGLPAWKIRQEERING
jgi:hypothetical protein